MASVRHFSIRGDETPPAAGSARPLTPTQAGSIHASRSSFSHRSAFSQKSNEDDEDDFQKDDSEDEYSLPSSNSSVISRIFDDYDFIKEIPECDMWEPIGDGPGKSFDFGSSGWTGSMNVGHELLQITAPDSACGLVYIRGSFANDPDAILARAQRRVGGKSTFGVKVVNTPDDPGYELGRRGEEGLLNFRWPYIDFPLTTPGCEAGTCSKFTFIRKGILYQVLRFLPGAVETARENSTKERDTKSKVDTETNIQKRHTVERGKQPVSNAKPTSWSDRSVKVRVGGKLRFGCPCQRKISQQEGKHFVETKDSTLTVTNNTYNQRLEIRLFIDGEQADPAIDRFSDFGEEIDATFEKSILLTPSKPRVVVATFKFCNKSKDVVNHSIPHSRVLRQELGFSIRSKNAHDRVWLRQIENVGGADYFDTCPAAACLEQILGVTAVPVRWKTKSPPPSPRSVASKKNEPVVEGEALSPADGVSVRSRANSRSSIDKKAPSVDYTPVEEFPRGQNSDDLDPTQIPLPLSRTTTESSSTSGGVAASTRKGSESSIHKAKSLKSIGDEYEVEALRAYGPSSSEADEEHEIESEFKPSGQKDGFQISALPPLPPSEDSFFQVGETSPTALSPFRSKPSISLNTDPGFLSRNQSRVSNSGKKSPSSGNKLRPIDQDDDGEPILGIALMGGCLGYQHVDVQRSLWQIRFLVKAHQFHSCKPKADTPRSPGSAFSFEATVPLDKIRESLLSRIEYTLYHSLIWIVHVKLSHNYFATPATTPFKRWKRPDCGYFLDPEVEHDRTLYAPIIIWYVLKNCPPVVPQSFRRRLRKNLVRMRNQYKGDEELSDPDHKAKLCILLWYFYGCLEKLLTEVFYTPGYDPFEFYTDELRQKTKKRVEEDREDCRKRTRDWQKKAEKVMLAARKQQAGAYSDEHEIVDRLAFLGIELGLVSKDAFKQPLSCVYQARRRILERTATKELNPGTGVLAFRNSASRNSTKAPWELTCLSHQGRLAVALWDETETDLEDLQLVRNDYHRFLTSNFTYVGSWDLSKSAAETWWDLDATSIISSTRLDLRMKMASIEAAKEVDTQIKSPNIDALLMSPKPISPLQLGDTSAAQPRPKPEVPEGRHLDDAVLDLLKKQLAQQNKIIEGLKSESDVAFDYDWTRMEPGPVLQPNEWVHSLDDTPELFQSSQTKTIQLRKRLLKYLVDSSKNEADDKARGRSVSKHRKLTEKNVLQPEWHPDTISKQFDVQELSYVSVANIEVWYDGLVRYELHGRLLVLDSVEDNDGTIIDLPFYDPSDNFNSTGPDADELALDLWTAYLDGYLRKDNDFSDFMYDELRNKFQSLSPEDKEVLQDERIHTLVKEDYKQTLLKCLNDSMVDCSARCRIYIIKRCTPAVVKASIYMWHTLAIDTYDDHFSDTSNFFNSNKEVWITSISISYWCFKRKLKGHGKKFDEGRDDAPFPPKKVIPQSKKKERWWKKVNNEKLFTKHIEERSSSLVITGDTTGHWWMMSIISLVLPDAVTAKAIKAASNSMKEFIHQPATSRCLTFLFFLGLICEFTSEKYEDILRELTIVIKLGREVLKKGLEKTQAEDSIMRLKSMLWALEALRILDDRLGESLDKIDDAKVRMLKYISHGPGRRQEHLERLCQGLIEDFGKRYDRLASVHSKIEQKIVQITRYREGITAVSNLEDTHTALTQNETVRILTYITIAYLPISYIAAVFSMDIVTSANWSAKIFAIMTAVFFICTLVLARSLGGLIRTWEEFGLLAGGWKGRTKFFGGTGHDDDSDDDYDDTLESSESEDDKVGEDDDAVSAISEEEKEEEKNRRKWPREYLRRKKTNRATTKEDPTSKGSVKAESVKSGNSGLRSKRGGSAKAESIKAQSVKAPSSEKRVSFEAAGISRQRTTPGSARSSLRSGNVNGTVDKVGS